ncbi:hypothetical protein QEZ54_08710 [Catellatospora sp. KI3]|uniref:hypothetical protein n=1 Tax=Catellatospora sp. KI3 TaxID=3041620 RepID=UPI0024821881|nr:hypothetical protein [Catellatospora sp. KI3]MDI1461043.1 hypothetical protein [Catellatospora sp. KI3]
MTYETAPRPFDDPATAALAVLALKKLQKTGSPALREMAAELLAGRAQLRDVARSSELVGPFRTAAAGFQRFRDECPPDMYQRMTDYAARYKEQLRLASDKEDPQ